jgi:hypothetical protein
MGLMFTVAAMFPVGAIAAGAVGDVIGLRALAVIEGTIIVAMAPLVWSTVLRHVMVDAQ